MLRKLSISLVIILALVVIVPPFISLDHYKPLILEKISAQLGRPVQIGAIHAQLIPTLGATVEDVVISNVAGGKAPYVLSLPKASIAVAFGPLLHKKVQITNITLHAPDVQLETLGNGQNNYTFTPTTPTTSTATTDNTTASQDAFSFDAIELADARITLLKPAADPMVVGPFNATIQAQSLQGPFTVAGDMIFNTQHFDITSNIGKIVKDAPIDFKSTIGLPQKAGSLDLQGQALLGNTPQVSAGFKLAFSPLAKLIGAFAGNEPHLPPMMATLETVQGKFKFSNGDIVANNIQIRGPQFAADGAINVPNAGPIVGNWQLGEINLASAEKPTVSNNNEAVNMAAQSQAVFAQLQDLFKTKIPALARPFKQTITVRSLAYKTGTPALKDFKATIESDASSLKISDILLSLNNAGQIAINAAAMHSQGQLKQLQVNVVGQGRNLNNLLKTFGMANNASLAKDFKTNLSIAANPTQIGIKFDDLAFGDIAAQNGTIILQPTQFDASMASLTASGKQLNQVKATGNLTDTGVKNLSANANLSGTSLQAKGNINSLKDLSGLDLALDINSQNLSETMRALGNTSASNLGASHITGNIKGSQKDLEMNVQGTLDSGKINMAGRVQNFKTFDGTVNITHPETATILRNFAKMNPAGNLGAFSLQTKLAAGAEQIVADPFEIKLGKAGSLQGKIITAKNNIDINLEGRTLDLAAITGESNSATNGDDAPSTTATTGWSNTPINLSFLHNASGKVRLKLDNFAVKKFKFEPFELGATVNDGILTISQLGGGLYDGTATLSGTLKAGDTNHAHNGNFDIAIKNVQVKKFFASLNSKAFESGVVNVTQNVRFNGASQAGIIGSLNGDGTLQVNDGVLNGFDLDAIAGKMDRFNSLTDALNMLGQLKAGGTTKFSNLDGKMVIRNGIITPQNMFMTTEKTRTEFSGSANAPAQYVDMHGLVNFTEQRNMPPLGLVVKGPFSNPYKGLDTGSIENFAKQKLQDAAVKKLQNTLQDKLGDKFPFLKSGNTAAPATTTDTATPATDSVAPADTTAEPAAVTPAPAPATAAPQKPKDALKDVANDLLKGALGF